MVTEKSWDDFRNSGMLWFANMILHTFGWAIVVEYDENDLEEKLLSRAYPARVKFRGFDGESNDKGYQKVSRFMKENADELLKESLE